MFVDADDPVKFSLLTLTNDGAAARTLSVFGYNEWVLGPPRDGEHLHVVTEHATSATGAILARNAYNQEFAGARRVLARQRAAAFGHRRSPRRSSAATATLSRPAALRQRDAVGPRRRRPRSLRGAAGPMRPASRARRRQLVFLLGQGTDRDHAARADRAARTRRRAREAALARVQAAWDDTLDADPGAHAGRFVRRADEPLAALSDAQLPALDAQPATTSPAARSAFAISCRT